MMLNCCNNVVIVSAACTDVSGLVTFLEGRNPAEGKVASGCEMKSGGLPVPAVTVDDICTSLQVKPTVLKIDVEGAELKVLYGAQNMLAETKPSIFFSVHSDDLRDGRLSFLANRGYHISPVGTAGSEFVAIFRIDE